MTGFTGPPVPVTPDPLGTWLGGTVDTVGTESVQLPGAVAHVDPAAPWAPPAVIVLDLDAAAETLDELWGSHAVDLVAGGGVGQLDLDLAGPGLAALQDLGTARWLRRWQPYPLDPGLLLLDVLIARAGCEHLLEDPGNDDDADAEVDGGPDLTTAHELAGRIRSTLEAAPDGRTPPPWVTSLGRPRAAVAATAPLLQMQGSTSADWDRVPVGTVTRAESAVHWSVETVADATTLHVLSPTAQNVLRHPLSPVVPGTASADELRFRLYAPGWPLPLVEGVLARVGSADSWAGSVPLSAEAADRAHQAGPRQVLLDVLRPGLTIPPRTGSRALRARARRWGIRAVAAGRLGEQGPPSTLLTESLSAARQAVGTWTALGATEELGVLARWSRPTAERAASRLGLAERWSLVHGQGA